MTENESDALKIKIIREINEDPNNSNLNFEQK